MSKQAQLQILLFLMLKNHWKYIFKAIVATSGLKKNKIFAQTLR